MTARSRVSFVHSGPTQWFDPVVITPAALFEVSRQPAARAAVLETLRRLQPDDYVEYLIGYLEHGQTLLGSAWDYTDLLHTLHAGARLVKPTSYLEIGVRRGRSMAVVVSQSPDVSAWGLDLWVPNYAGLENPGPDFVRAEMQRLGHRGTLTLISGDSRQSLPALLSSQPDLRFDMVTVDGDHSVEGAAHDLRAVMPRIKPGGIIFFDDVGHPLHADLAACWRDVVAADERFHCGSYTGLGYGIATAIRKGAL